MCYSMCLRVQTQELQQESCKKESRNSCKWYRKSNMQVWPPSGTTTTGKLCREPSINITIPSPVGFCTSNYMALDLQYFHHNFSLKRKPPCVWGIDSSIITILVLQKATL